MAPILTSDSMVASPPADQPATSTGGALSMNQLCPYIGLGKTKIYAEAKAGRLELLKVGSKTIALRSEADRYLRALPTMTAIEELDRKAKPGKPRRSTSNTTNEPPARAGSDVRHQAADLDAEPAQ
jgi:hypothetical protein